MPAAFRTGDVPLLRGTRAGRFWERRSTAHRGFLHPWPFSRRSSVWSVLSRKHVEPFSAEIFCLCELDHVACDKSPSLSPGILKTDEAADSWLLTLYANDEL